MLNVENVQRIAKALTIPVASFFDAERPHISAEPALSYGSSEEKSLLRNFRDIHVRTDRQLAINFVRRLAKK